jgi:pyruvate dehydrogenase complex dehydrogenase (E1) component
MDDALWNFEELLLLEPSFDATTWILNNNLQRLDQLVVKSFEALAKYAE